MYFKIADEDKALFHELTTAGRSTQVIAAANLAKIGRLDVLAWVSHVPGMLEDVKARLESQGYEIDTTTLGDDRTCGMFNREAAEGEFHASADLRKEFQNLETYLAYCEARCVGKIKILGKTR